MSILLQTVQHDCTKPGCKIKAECIPVLVVPSSPLAANQTYTGCRNVLWMPLCDMHFNAMVVREFLTDDVIAGMRASIEQDFRENQSTADWSKAQIQKLGRHTKEFKGHERIYLNVRAGMPANLAVGVALQKRH